ncbi:MULTISPECIES: sensor histidine kinase [Actinomadura]|uniref:sensor histidine kinase n=1 Tax=Actinomadura TaxID=1988 RepID=UPI001BE4A59B|nr:MULTISPECIES: ATP-binding protein [Actinomadura]MBT2208997.1 HAMP domain-containing protein [Actinomadura sp. NEAU-AAG7]
MSLRRRLILSSVALAALGLLLAGLATFAAVRDWTSGRDERMLTSPGRRAEAVIGSREALRTASAPDDVTALWRVLAADGAIPSLFQIRAADGRVLQTVNYGPVPELPGDLAPGRVTDRNPDGERFLTIGGGDSGFRVRTAWLPGPAGAGPRTRFLVLGVQNTESEELEGRTAGSMTVFGLLALLGVALVAGLVVKRGLRPLEQFGATAAAIGAGDLTRRVRRADRRTEVGRLGQALNGMLGQIEAAFRERRAAEERLRRFVADASHELRTPVATIRGYAELFRRGAAGRPEDLAKAMARIESEAERMSVLVDELLLLARLDQGRALEREPVDLAALAGDAVSDARAVAPGRPVALEGEGPLIVAGDAHRLRQVLANLLANIRQHTPDGTAAVVRYAARSDGAVVEVEDEGPGLTAEQRSHAFERFYRADASRSRDRGGSGLGLSIVAAVVSAHGGEVGLDAAPGGGMLVRIRLPLAVPDNGDGFLD